MFCGKSRVERHSVQFYRVPLKNIWTIRQWTLLLLPSFVSPMLWTPVSCGCTVAIKASSKLCVRVCPFWGLRSQHRGRDRTATAHTMACSQRRSHPLERVVEHAVSTWQNWDLRKEFPDSSKRQAVKWKGTHQFLDLVRLFVATSATWFFGTACCRSSWLPICCWPALLDDVIPIDDPVQTPKEYAFRTRHDATEKKRWCWIQRLQRTEFLQLVNVSMS